MIGTLALFAIALGVSGWIGVAVLAAVAVKHLARRVLA
jgi:hypothetical protein